MEELINTLLNFRSATGPSPPQSRNSSAHSGKLFTPDEGEYTHFVHFFVQGANPNVWIDVTHDNTTEIHDAMFKGIDQQNVKYMGLKFSFHKLDNFNFILENEQVGMLKCIKIKLPFHTGNLKILDH